MRTDGEKTNSEFAHEDTTFKIACEQAKVEPTTRQASKYRRKRGAAWKVRKVTE